MAKKPARKAKARASKAAPKASAKRGAKGTARAKGNAKKVNRGIPVPIRSMLWGRAAGRCQFYTCNKVLHRHPDTQDFVNLAELAHIIGFSEDGPRGEKDLSPELAKDIDNLMLLCAVCHTTIDEHVGKYTVGWLREMKAQHELRMELLTGIAPERSSHVLLYAANIGEQSAKISFQQAAAAMVPNRCPADGRAVEVGLKNSAVKDRDEEFWKVESNQLETKFRTEFLPRLEAGKANHVSVFAFAPQPLLMQLGYLLSDITHADVYQLHREPATWTWLTGETELRVKVEEPQGGGDEPALVLALSSAISDDRVLSVLPKAAIWRVTIDQPHNDFLKTREQLQVLRECLRPLMDCIRERHGTSKPLSVFPAMPVAAAVEFGRLIMPKAAMEVAVYDENIAKGGFAYALTLSPKPVGERRS